MNPDYPPLHIPTPQVADRRKEKPRLVPLEPERLLRRQEFARRLVDLIRPLSRSLHQMTEAERKAVFYKLEHEVPIDLTGTDMKPMAEHSDHFTLAVPRVDNLDKLINKIDTFGVGELKHGHAPNEQLAARIVNLIRGDPKDRLSQALFEKYDQLVRQDWVICEIEMVSLAQGNVKQRQELQHVRQLLQQSLGSAGMNGNFFEHEESGGTCRAVIRCTGRLFQTLVEGQEWQTRLSWFDAKPKFETFSTVLQNFSRDAMGTIDAPPESASVVCIVDSGVASGNPFLTPVVRTDLLKSFLKHARMQPSDEYGHGTGIASLASYYVLNLHRGATNSGKVWIAGARVLNAENQTEEDSLFSKTLAEVVETFVPLGVRIFNLSVNVINRMWNAEARRTISRQSWIARTIDRLSREKDIVFVVSTGNISTHDVQSYIASGRSYPEFFDDEEAAILDPAQAALALTVGSVSPGTLIVGPTGTAVALAATGQPSPFTRRGPGISREIKPELVDFGGNYVHDPAGGQVRSNLGTDVMMASHQLTPAVAHDSGSSFAAPRIAHKLAMILADLQIIDSNHISAPLLKAFLVNSASWDRLGSEFEQFRDDLDRIKLNLWRNVVGYGLPDASFATDCDPFSAVLYYQGTLEPDHVSYFDLPVPAVLRDTGDGIKRLTITLVHTPEVQRWGLERYLGTTMKWRLFRGDVDKDEIIAAMSVEDGDAEEPERPGELPGKLRVNLRSRGCVQHDIFEWSRHQDSYSAGTYTLSVAAYRRWNRKVAPIPFAVVARIEDTTRTAHVYAEVQNILTQIEVRART